MATTTFPFEGSYAISLWLKLDALPGAASYGVIWSIENTSTDGQLLRVDSSGNLVLTEIAQGSFQDDVGTTVLSTGTWYHVLFTQIDQTQGEVYLDGVKEIVMSEIGQRGSADSNVLYFGIYAGLVYAPDGQMDAIKTYDIDLSQDQARREMWTRSPQHRQPRHWWDPLPLSDNKTVSMGTAAENLTVVGTISLVDGAPIGYSTPIEEDAWFAPPKTISPTGIASVQAFGTTTLRQSVAPTGIASAQAFGTATLRLSILSVGIASAEAHGTSRLQLTIRPGGIASLEAFGATALRQSIQPSSIASAEAFGIATLRLSILPTAIASVEAFGTAALRPTIGPSGIVSAEAFGIATLRLSIVPIGIIGAEAFGMATFRLSILPASIVSAEAFGTAILRPSIRPISIDSAETMGALRLRLTIYPSGIASAEVFGSPTLQAPNALYLIGIASGETFGVLRLRLTILPASIASAEVFGLPIISFGLVAAISEMTAEYMSRVDMSAEFRSRVAGSAERRIEVVSEAEFRQRVGQEAERDRIRSMTGEVT